MPGKRPLINTPYENSRPRTLVTLDQAVNWPRLTAWPGCGRKIHSCSPALQLLGQRHASRLYLGALRGTAGIALVAPERTAKAVGVTALTAPCCLPP